MTSSGEASQSSHLSLTNLILVSLVAGSGLFIVNTVILVSLCYRRSGGPRLAPRWDRAGDRLETSSTECLSSSQPTTPHLLPTFSTPGRTSTLHSQSVALSAFPPGGHDCGAGKYRSYSSAGSYVGLSPSLLIQRPVSLRQPKALLLAPTPAYFFKFQVNNGIQLQYSRLGF